MGKDMSQDTIVYYLPNSLRVNEILSPPTGGVSISIYT